MKPLSTNPPFKAAIRMEVRRLDRIGVLKDIAPFRGNVELGFEQKGIRQQLHSVSWTYRGIKTGPIRCGDIVITIIPSFGRVKLRLKPCNDDQEAKT